MQRILLTRDLVALVDDLDFLWLDQWSWTADKKGKNFYAVRKVKTDKGWRLLLMHRLLMGVGPGHPGIVDHLDGNGLNNQRSNLRICSPAQNRWHTRRRRRGKSGYIGVVLNRHGTKWEAKIGHDGNHNIYIGSYATAEEAARAYDRRAVELRGSFAVTNFPLSA